MMDPLLNQAFVYTRIPMGSKSGSHMMQRAASNLLFEDINVENYASYVDDAIIFCDDEEEMFLMLKQILRNYCRNGFKINPGKCAFFVRETVAFGYKISLKGIQSDPSKVKAFDEIRRPVTKKDLRSAMGKFSYYRRTVPKFAEITGILYEMLKQNGKTLKWNENRTRGWYSLLEAMKKSVLLNRPNFDKDFYIVTDASSIAVGGCLKQLDEDGELRKIISVYSYKLTDRERNFENSVRELYAIFRCTRAFETYVFGRTFKIITDCRINVIALTAGEKQIARSGQLSPCLRYVTYLSQFSFEISHSSGKAVSFCLVDLLSRLNMDTKDKILRFGRNTRECLLFLEDIKTGKLDGLVKENVVFRIEPSIMTNAEQLSRSIEDAQRESKRCHNLKLDLENGIIKGFQVDKRGIIWKGDKLVCPPHFYWELLESLHHHNEGQQRLLERIKENKIHLEFKYRLVDTFIKSCSTCQEVQGFGKLKGKNQSLNDLTDINQSCCADIFWFGDKPVMLMVDEYSKFIWTKIMRNDTSDEYIETMADLILRFGGIRRLRTDNAAQWRSKKFEEFITCLGVVHTRNIPRWSPGNGIAERHVGLCQAELRAMEPKDDGTDLGVALVLTTLKLNTTKRKGMEYSPLQIHLGRNTVLMNQLPGLSKTAVRNLSTRMRRVYDNLSMIKERLLSIEREKLKKLGDIEHPQNIHKNMLVKIINYRQPGQLKKKYRPFSRSNYVVLKVLPWCNSALVERVTTTSRLRPLRCRVHFNQIKVIKQRNYDEFKDDLIDNSDGETEENDDQLDVERSNAKEVSRGEKEAMDDNSQTPDEVAIHMDNKYNLRPRQKVTYK